MALDIDLFLDETKSKSKKPNKSKSKGNSFENKIAKLLSKWIFGDIDFLQRSITSGAIKRTNIYLGDIVPQKQLPWKEFIFLIECKNGYKQNISNFNNTTLIDTWLTKCLNDRTSDQPIIWLIIGFHSYEPLFITDLELSIKSKLVIKEAYNRKLIPFYIYKFKDLLQYDFYDLYSHNQEILKVLNVGP